MYHLKDRHIFFLMADCVSGNPDESQIRWEACVAGTSFRCPDPLSTWRCPIRNLALVLETKKVYCH